MMKLVQLLAICTLCSVMVFGMIEARPQNAIDNNQEMDAIEPEVDDTRNNNYYDLSAVSPYSSIPIDRLQMLIAQYRPTGYFRTPGWSNGMNELFRVPETKRQVRYRQCYFNPISCFKK